MENNIYTINKFNLKKNIPLIEKYFEKTIIYSIDLEFSGLGNNKELLDKNIENRHKAVHNLVKEFGILEIGLTLFISNEKDYLLNCYKNEIKFDTITFNFITCPSNDIKISPHSLIFLRNNNLDLNNWIEKAILYESKGFNKGKPIENTDINNDFHNLFSKLFSLKKPIIVHNGWIDIAFLYFTFCGTIANVLTKSINGYTKFFPYVYDTKYIARNYTSVKHTFLDYLYIFIENEIKTKNINILLNHIKIDDESKEEIEEKVYIIKEKYCKSFIQKGTCERGIKCPASHNLLEYILEEEEEEKKKDAELKIEHENKKRKLEDNFILYKPIDKSNNNSNATSHSAGFDSYCTGYIFLYYLHEIKEKDIKDCLNKVYLSDKNIPLLFEISLY